MRVLELNIFTQNIEETEDFYNKILGFKILEKSNDKICFETGKSKLIFTKNNGSKKYFYHFAFNIPKNEIENAKRFLLSKLDLIEYENDFVIKFENWNAKAVFFYDNNENILEFIERENTNEKPEKEFNINSVLSLSEIGIGTDKPLNLGTELTHKIGMDFYEKGPKRDDFVALGNDNGLFVISSQERKWFPTEKFVEKSPLKVKIEINSKEYEQTFN